MFLAELAQDIVVLGLDLLDGSARYIESNAGSIKVVGEKTEGPYILPHHFLYCCSYRPRLFQRKIKFKFFETVRKLSLSRKGFFYDVIEHLKVALVVMERRISHLLPSNSKLFFIIIRKAGLEIRRATILIFAVTEEIQDDPKHFLCFRVCSVSLLEFVDVLFNLRNRQKAFVDTLVCLQFLFYFIKKLSQACV